MYVFNDPVDLAVYFTRKGIPDSVAYDLGESLYDERLCVSFEWSEALCLEHALLSLSQLPEHRAIYEHLALTIDWQSIYDEARRDVDKHWIAMGTCKQFMTERVM
jgi:hypothetical protein